MYTCTLEYVHVYKLEYVHVHGRVLGNTGIAFLQCCNGSIQGMLLLELGTWLGGGWSNSLKSSVRCSIATSNSAGSGTGHLTVPGVLYFVCQVCPQVHKVDQASPGVFGIGTHCQGIGIGN